MTAKKCDRITAIRREVFLVLRAAAANTSLQPGCLECVVDRHKFTGDTLIDVMTREGKKERFRVIVVARV